MAQKVVSRRLSLPYPLAILVGRAVRVATRLRKRGGGTAVPGLVVNTIAPGLLPTVLNSFREGVVIITGTSGKSTTTKMLCATLKAHGLAVFTNESTANISQGLMSSILRHIDLRGRVDADIAVLEMDEGHAARIVKQLKPRVAVLTNVMTDQIDRFHDPEMVADMMQRVAERATTFVVTNADDAVLESRLANLDESKVVRFGVSRDVMNESPRGLGYLRVTEDRLDRGTIVSAVTGTTATLVHNGAPAEVRLPARGVHFAVDAAAAVAATAAIMGQQFDLERTAEGLSNVLPVFGRGEVLTVRGKKVHFVLVQNPASFQLNIDQLDRDLEQVMVAVGSDVRDPSYLWPVDTASLGRVTTASGSLAEEIALQLVYSGVIVDRVDPDLPGAVDEFLALPEPSSSIKTVIFSADSMRRVRAHLGLT